MTENDIRKVGVLSLLEKDLKEIGVIKDPKTGELRMPEAKRKNRKGNGRKLKGEKLKFAMSAATFDLHAPNDWRGRGQNRRQSCRKRS